MTKLPILEIPHPALFQKADSVEKITPDIRQLLDDMLETMYESHGVGLAGNQIGVLKRLVVIDCSDDKEHPDPIKLINPVIIEKSIETRCESEGCLSIPREYAAVERAASVTVSYLDENGHPQKRTATGLLSVAIQHELDHLDGILFIDHLSALKRKLLLKHLEKRRKKQTQQKGETA